MLRAATAADLTALRDLEREANLVALRHVFPPERFPFPDDDVLARWSIMLADADAEVLVLDAEDGGLALLAAYDSASLRHLAVRPDHWGRGLATYAVEAVLHAMDRRGTVQAHLWCLTDNHRARRLYHRLGWRPTDERREAPWPPFPTEMRYTRLVVASDR